MALERQRQTSQNGATAGKRAVDERAVADNDDKVALRKQMSLLFCIAMIVGSTIGSGIFISPKGVLLYSKSVGVSLVIWAATGVLALFGALSSAELGTTFGKSGGEYTYIREAFGPLPAFLVVWGTVVVQIPAGGTILSMTFARYVIWPFYPGCEPPALAITMVSLACLMFAYSVNCRRVDVVTALSIVFTFAKVIGLVVIIIGGIIQLSRGRTEHLENAFEEKPDSLMDLSLAIYQAMFAYGGWETLNNLTEELKNPIRDFPIAVVVSELIIISLYLMANIAYFTTLSPEQLLASSAVGVTFADLALGSFAWLVPLAVGISVFGSLNGGVLSRTRVVFTGARDGHLPASLCMVHIDYRTPMPALLSGASISVTLLIASGFTGAEISNLMNYMSFSSWVFKALVYSGLIYMRWTRPDIPRPFKVPIVIPLVFSLASVYLCITGIIAAPIDAGLGLAILSTGVPVYYFGEWKKPRLFYRVTDAAARFMQKFLFVVRQEKKTY